MSNQLTTTENAPWIPEIVANEAIGYLGSYLNLGATVTKDSELTGSVRVGQTVNVPKRGVVVAQQKTEDSDVTSQKIAGTEVPVTIDQHWYVRLSEEDFTAAMQVGSTLPGYVEDALIVLAEKIESNLASHITEFDNIDAGSDAILSVQNVRERMALNKIPRLARKYGYIHPSFVTELLSENAFVDPKIIPNNNALTEGAVGRVGGFDLFEGQLVPGEGSPSWYQNFFYTRAALVLATRPLQLPGRNFGVESAYVQSDAGVGIRVMRLYDDKAMAMVGQLDVAFGSAVMDSRQGFVLESQ
jgi:hypothetical protein